jgi:hypothetical protein
MSTFASNNKALRRTAALALALAGLAGQAAHADNLNPILGGGLGAMAGAYIGQSVGGRDGAMIGAAVGGVAGVGIASEGQRRYYEPARTTVYQESYRAAPTVVYQESYRPAPVVVYQQPYRPAPVYGYREVERISYPVHDYGRRGWGALERGWERHDGYRHDGGFRGDFRGGEHHGWDRRD